MWTIRRATGIGVTAGVVAAILWPFYALGQDPFYWPFVAVLAVTAFCGLSILLFSGLDIVLRERGRSVRPIRAFDLLLGLLLSAPSLVALAVLL